MTDIVIVSAVRTAVGKFGGALAKVSAVDLGALVIKEAVARANLERAQLLVESPSRRALQLFLGEWGGLLASIKAPSRLRWHLEVDPFEF